MGAIADQLRRDAVRRHDRGQAPGIPVRERPHGIEAVRHVRDAEFERTHRLLVRRVGVSDRRHRP